MARPLGYLILCALLCLQTACGGKGNTTVPVAPAPTDVPEAKVYLALPEVRWKLVASTDPIYSALLDAGVVPKWTFRLNFTMTEHRQDESTPTYEAVWNHDVETGQLRILRSGESTAANYTFTLGSTLEVTAVSESGDPGFTYSFQALQ